MYKNITLLFSLIVLTYPAHAISYGMGNESSSNASVSKGTFKRVSQENGSQTADSIAITQSCGNGCARKIVKANEHTSYQSTSDTTGFKTEQSVQATSTMFNNINY
jgi:hypothetical protein